MAGTTPGGLHRPIGSDPVQPATLATRLTDPTDVGLLADSLEARRIAGAWATTGPVTVAPGSDGVFFSLPIADQPHNVGFAAFSGGPNYLVTIPMSGWYAATAAVQIGLTSGTAGMHAAIVFFTGGSQYEVRAGDGSPVPNADLTIADLRYLAAGDTVAVRANSTVAGATISPARLSLHRVA